MHILLCYTMKSMKIYQSHALFFKKDEIGGKPIGQKAQKVGHFLKKEGVRGMEIGEK
jgi:hypothetical protein